MQTMSRDIITTTVSTTANYLPLNNRNVPSKQIPDLLCECPQLCHHKIPDSLRKQLYEYFMKFQEEPEKQNKLLQNNMKIQPNRHESLRNEDGDPIIKPKRVLCKYYLPDLRTKEQIEVCQKAFINAFMITTKRVRMQREKLISRIRFEEQLTQRPCLEVKPITNNQRESVKSVKPQITIEHQFDSKAKYQQEHRQYNLLNSYENCQILKNFFENQLWNFHN